GNPIGGGFTGQTYIIEQTPGDTTPPAVSSINRQSPAGQTTNATSLTFRATFSEAVTGVDAADFLVVLTSSATGTIGTVTPVSGSTYDVTVTGVGGNGTVGLNLKGSGTGIADAAGNPIGGGFTGETYIIQQAATGLGFASVINLNPVDARVDATKEKQQAKVFVNRGRHWAIIPNSSGTFLWRLDGTTWTSILRLSTRNARADAVVKEDTTHIFLFAGPASELVSVEYIPATNTYEPWSRRRVKTDITLDEGVETGSITLDATGRMWLASDGLTTINVRYSDRPYTSWSGPVNIASGVSGDDICAVFHLPALNRIGILWSNQTTDRFGFRTHINGTSPTTWTADEVPASQSALNVGRGMSDDHLNMKVASDGTLYCAVKTSYDEPGFPVIALLIRRPTGSWDDLYEVAQNGTRPIVLLNEAQNKLKVVYTSQINGGDIQYKGSLMSAINFSPQLTLISGINNNVTSTHQNYTSEIVILASNSTQAVGVLASDVAPGRPEPGDSLAGAEQQVLRAFPNPFTTSARLRFQVPVAGPFSLAVYDGKGLVFQKQGSARAGEEQEVELAGAALVRGLYFVRLQTAEGVKTLKLILDK
ncbi:MAG: T9SS type A sorting domain-containing protein, partial [Adhaeribacter sp.]